METITLSENIGIKNIKEFHLQLLEILRREGSLILDFSRVKSIDLSLAQVLMASRRFFKSNRKKLKLKNVCAVVRKQLQLTGLVK